MPEMAQEQAEALAHLVSIGYDPANITPERLQIETLRRWVSGWQDTTLKHYGPDDIRRWGVLSVATSLYADAPRFVKENSS